MRFDRLRLEAACFAGVRLSFQEYLGALEAAFDQELRRWKIARPGAPTDRQRLRQRPCRRLSGACAAVVLVAASGGSASGRGVISPDPTFDFAFSSPANTDALGGRVTFLMSDGTAPILLEHLNLREDFPLPGHAVPLDGTPIFDHAFTNVSFETRRANEPPSRRNSIDQSRADFVITGPTTPPQPGDPVFFSMALTSFTVSGGTLPPGVLLEIKEHRVAEEQLKANPRHRPARDSAWEISGTISFELAMSTDGGQTWTPGDAPISMDYVSVPAPGVAGAGCVLSAVAIRRRRSL